MMMFKSLKNQLLFYFFLATSSVLIVFSVFIFIVAQSGIVHTLDAELKLISLDAIIDLKDDAYVNANKISTALKKEFEFESLEMKILYYNKKNKNIEHISISSEKFHSLFKLPLHELVGLYSIDYYDIASYRVSSMLVSENENVKTFIQLARKKVTTSPYLENLLLQLIFSVPLIIVFLLLMANWLLKKSVEPFSKTVDAVNKLSGQDLKKRLISENAPLEIRVLINTFNALLQRLEESFSRISSFSADASHELKTPLTVILGEAEVGLRKERTSSQYQSILKGIIEEGKYVQEIIDQLFFLARKDTHAFSRSFHELYLDELIVEVVEQAQVIAKIKSINLYLENINPATIFANEVLLKTALLNLVKNAITYSDKGSEVKISLYDEGKAFVLIIEDKGCGISPDALKYVFERFYRVDKSRSRKAGRTGLGLSIVKTILDIHNYSIDIESVLTKGTRAKIRFPNEENEKYLAYEDSYT